MRNLLALLGAAVVTVAGLGWYLDWFKVHKGPTDNGKQNYNVEFNTTKIGEDLHKSGTKLQETIEKKFPKKELAAPMPPAPPEPEPSPFDLPAPGKSELVPEPPSSISPDLVPPITTRPPQR